MGEERKLIYLTGLGAEVPSLACVSYLRENEVPMCLESDRDLSLKGRHEL